MRGTDPCCPYPRSHRTAASTTHLHSEQRARSSPESQHSCPCAVRCYAEPHTAAHRSLRNHSPVHAFFRWLHQNGVILIDPSEKVLQHSVISPLPEILTEQEIEKVISAANHYREKQKPDIRPYLLFTLLLYTGLKKGETLAITHNHIDLESPQGPILFVRYASPQYRYKERKIPLPDLWVDAYLEYQKQMPSSERLFPWSQRRLEYILEDLGKEAGLSKHLSFDMCRWTCALVDWKSGMERDKIRQKLGLSKVQWREISMKLNRLAEMNP